MVIIPSILYHGTTILRWELIKKTGHLNVGERGYVYGVTNLHTAIEHGWTRYIEDRYLSDNHYYDLNPGLRDCIVIGIETKYLDRKYLTWREHFGEVWYTYSTNIPIRALFEHEIYPLPDRYDTNEFIRYINKTWKKMRRYSGQYFGLDLLNAFNVQ